MKKLIAVVLMMLIAQTVYAKNLEVKTGYGYMKDLSGNIVTKCRLAPGAYPMKSGYEYFEVDTIEELNAIEVYVEPVDPNIAIKYKADLLKVLDITEADITKLKTVEDLQGKVTTLETKMTKAETDITELKAK